MIKKIYYLIISTLIIFTSCSSISYKKPKLVVMLVVDHMRPDLLTRFDDIYDGGFRWLIDNGVWFSNTHHNHSYTATGPGHTAIGYGQHPGKVGVIGNSFYDRELKKNVNCVEDPNAKVIGSTSGKARSTVRYNAKGLGDWIKAAYPQSKVISIAGKDRTACLMGGEKPDIPIYYNKAGSFISSDHYIDVAPDWLNNFNENLNIDSYKDSIWEKSLKNSYYEKYARNDHYIGETDDYLNALYSPVFPIGFDRDVDPRSSIMGRPWFEREVLKLSKLAIVEEKLGKDISKIILPITDPYVVHHGALGSFATVYLDDKSKIHDAIAEIKKIEDIEVVLTNAEACNQYDLPKDRMGDIICMSSKNSTIGSAKKAHDLSKLKEPLRSHGGLHEREVPFISNKKINLTDANVKLNNYDAFYYAISGAM